MTKKENHNLGFSTKAIHAGQEPSPQVGAIMTPIYQTTTFVQPSPGVHHENYDYSRAANPTRTALEANLAALENARSGIAFSSGCAAADAVLHLLQSGDHVICCDDVYGGTYRLFTQVFQQLGLTFSFVDMADPKSFSDALTDKTKLVWLETPTNPLLKLIDIEAVASIAKKSNALVVVDNTFCSPYVQQPLKLGADLVVHSSTKYLGGHSDVVGGVVLTDNDELAEKLYFLQKSVGAVPSPFECFLLLRSTKTLAVRLERHCANAQVLAESLEARDDLQRVIYPGLPAHPQHALCQKQMKSGGGIITIELPGGLARTKKFLESLQVFSLAESLGGVESLVDHPGIMTHASMPESVRNALGITDGLVRLSVGIEDVDDLKNDLLQALDVSRN